MFNTIKEKAGILSKLGSFYYQTLLDQAKDTARKLSHIPFESRIITQFGNVIQSTLSKSYFNDNYKVIHFKDEDIEYFGMQDISEKGVPAILQDYLMPSLNDTLSGIATNELQGILGHGYGQAQLSSGLRLVYGLRVPKDILVTSIKTKDAILLLNIDFKATYGFIWFQQNPISLFPSMKMMAQSYTQRRKNILSYTLGLGEVYGDITEIIKYYRVNQSPSQFLKAAAQACGIPVIQQDDIITAIVPLYQGYSYITQTGTRYDATYPHTQLSVGDHLIKGQLIGNMLDMILPNQEVPDYIEEIHLQNSCPVPGIKVPNKDIQIYDEEGNFKPAYTGRHLNKYLQYLEAFNNNNNNQVDSTVSRTQNGVEHFRSVIAKNRAIILVLNKNMPNQMALSLLSFIGKNAPIGSVLVYSYL